MSHVRMPFGKHKGELLGDVPTDYLGWLLRECDLEPYLRAAVEAEHEFRWGPRHGRGNPGEGTGPASPAGRAAARGAGAGASQGRALVDVRGVVKRWFAELALRYHKDRGGTDEAMRLVNYAHERLLQLLEAG
jgi:uncharacterized protein (DUF3820 family)